MDEREDRIRERAHRLWEQEGRPDGGAERHWRQAEEMVATEDGSLDNRQAGHGAEAPQPMPPASSPDVEEAKPANTGRDVLSTGEAAPARTVKKRPRPARPTRSS